MYALSLWRPWPWTFFHAGKRIENRRWLPPKRIIGQWVAMHAAQKMDRAALDALTIGHFGRAASCIPRTGPAHPTGIVGAMMVVGAFHLPDDVPKGQGALVERVGVVTAADILSLYAFGPWCWVISDVVELHTPIPCQGRQGLWRLTGEHADLVRTRIAEAA